MNSRSALSTDSDPSGRSDLSAHLPKLISIVLILLSLLTYWQVQNFDFINMDDPLYITDNPPVRNGLTREGILWRSRSTISATGTPHLAVPYG